MHLGGKFGRESRIFVVFGILFTAFEGKVFPERHNETLLAGGQNQTQSDAKKGDSSTNKPQPENYGAFGGLWRVHRPAHQVENRWQPEVSQNAFVHKGVIPVQAVNQTEAVGKKPENYPHAVLALGGETFPMM